MNVLTAIVIASISYRILRESSVGIEFSKTWSLGKPGHSAKPKTRVWAVRKTGGFRVCIFAQECYI